MPAHLSKAVTQEDQKRDDLIVVFLDTPAPRQRLVYPGKPPHGEQKDLARPPLRAQEDRTLIREQNALDVLVTRDCLRSNVDIGAACSIAKL